MLVVLDRVLEYEVLASHAFVARGDLGVRVEGPIRVVFVGADPLFVQVVPIRAPEPDRVKGLGSTRRKGPSWSHNIGECKWQCMRGRSWL